MYINITVIFLMSSWLFWLVHVDLCRSTLEIHTGQEKQALYIGLTAWLCIGSKLAQWKSDGPILLYIPIGPTIKTSVCYLFLNCPFQGANSGTYFLLHLLVFFLSKAVINGIRRHGSFVIEYTGIGPCLSDIPVNVS